MNEIIKNLTSHRSIRSYTDKAVDEKIIKEIIKAVQSAPNWVNLQHVSIISIKEKERLKKFTMLCGNQKHIEQAPIFLIFCADFYRTYLACNSKGQSFDDVINHIDNIVVGANEVGIAVGTAVTAAESFGLGTVPIGDIRLNALKVIKELNLPKYIVPLLGLCIGYPAENPDLKPRLPKEAIYFEEIYNKELSELLYEYDKIYSDYLKKRPWNNRVSNWTQLAADFYKPPYNHYPEVEEMLQQQGFIKNHQEV